MSSYHGQLIPAVSKEKSNNPGGVMKGTNSAGKIDKNNQPSNTPKGTAPARIYKRRVVDFSSGEEDFVPSHQRLTERGGYAHLKSSRLKISQANAGNVPWNKGKNRTVDAKAKISAGVRARNHVILLKKLEKLGMTETEWYAYKRKIKLIRERVRRMRCIVAKEEETREQRRLERRKEEEREIALRKRLSREEEEDDESISSWMERYAHDEEMSQERKEKEKSAKQEEITFSEERTISKDDHVLGSISNEAVKSVQTKTDEVNDTSNSHEKTQQSTMDGNRATPSIFVKDITWTPHPLDSTNISYKDLCPYGGPGGLICCEICAANYSKLLTKCYRNLEQQKVAKLGEEVSELLQFIKDAKQTLQQTVRVVRTKPVIHRDGSDTDDSDDFMDNDTTKDINIVSRIQL